MATFASIVRRTAARLAGDRRSCRSLLFSVLEQSLAAHRGRRPLAPSFPPNFCYTTSTNGASIDDPLLRVIVTEIKCAEETDDYNRVEETPRGFPFRVEDNPGVQTLTLTREFEGERVRVEVHMSSLVTGQNYDEDDDDNDANEGEDPDRPEKPRQSSIPLFVTFSKKTGASLEFRCTALPNNIVINDMSVRYFDSPSKDQTAYEGPSFRDLDEKLRKAFHRYIEMRGIKPSTMSFLHEYMINKDSREHLMWLKNLKKFFQT